MTKGPPSVDQDVSIGNSDNFGGSWQHSRIGADLTVYPGRIIESDVVLACRDDRSVIRRNVAYEDSDHLQWPDPESHSRLYPPQLHSIFMFKPINFIINFHKTLFFYCRDDNSIFIMDVTTKPKISQINQLSKRKNIPCHQATN